MALTPRTIVRHELVGLPVRVADASNADLIGIEGRVVDETMRTLVIDEGGAEKTVQKRGSTFEFRLPADAELDCDTDEAAGAGNPPGTPSELGRDTAGVRPRQSRPSSADDRRDCEGGAYVTVDGTRLLDRPAERTERRGDSKWR